MKELLKDIDKQLNKSHSEFWHDPPSDIQDDIIYNKIYERNVKLALSDTKIVTRHLILTHDNLIIMSVS